MKERCPQKSNGRGDGNICSLGLLTLQGVSSHTSIKRMLSEDFFGGRFDMHHKADDVNISIVVGRVVYNA